MADYYSNYLPLNLLLFTKDGGLHFLSSLFDSSCLSMSERNNNPGDDGPGSDIGSEPGDGGVGGRI